MEKEKECDECKEEIGKKDVVCIDCFSKYSTKSVKYMVRIEEEIESMDKKLIEIFTKAKEAGVEITELKKYIKEREELKKARENDISKRRI